MVLPFLAQQGTNFLASSILSGLFGGGGQDRTGQAIQEYISGIQQRPDYTYLQNDPLISNYRSQGTMQGNVAMQQALSNLIRSGFQRSNIGMQSAMGAGVQARSPYVNAEASMLSNLQNQAEQNRLNALRDVFSSRLGKAQRQEQTDTGLGLQFGGGLLTNLGNFNFKEIFSGGNIGPRFENGNFYSGGN